MAERCKRRSGITLEEYSDMQCCYSCAHCRKPNADGTGMCNKSGSKVKVYDKNVCCSYSDAELVLCEECDTYLRSLVRHVHKHGLTVQKYKENHGFNRGTPLTCVSTSELHREHGKKNMSIYGQYRTEGSKGKSWKVRDEGMLNQEKEFRRRGGFLFIRNMNKKATKVTKGSRLSD